MGLTLTHIQAYLRSFLQAYRSMGNLPLTISRFCLFATCEGEEPTLSRSAVNGRFFFGIRRNSRLFSWSFSTSSLLNGEMSRETSQEIQHAAPKIDFGDFKA